MAVKQAVENSADRELVVSRVFDAPRELVWAAWTKPENLMKWWGPYGFSTTVHKMEFRPGGQWDLTMRGPDGAEYPNKSEFVEIVKNERVVYRLAGGRRGGKGAHFLSTWTFEEVAGGKTRLTMRHQFDSKEDRDFVIKEYRADEGGQQTLERLEGELAFMKVAPFVIKRTFDAPRDLVWKAWTEEARLKEWFGPKGAKMTHAKMDFRPGGLFHYGMKYGDLEMWGKWTFREIVPPSKIVVVQSFSDAKGGITTHPLSPNWPREMFSVTTFTEKDGKTEIAIEWTPLNAARTEIDAFETARPSMNQGWGGTFEQLADYLAKR